MDVATESEVADTGGSTARAYHFSLAQPDWDW